MMLRIFTIYAICLLFGAASWAQETDGVPGTGGAARPTTLMTINVAWMDSGGGWRQRQPVMLEAIRAANPDVICFQEPQLVQREALARDLPEYGTRGNVEGRAADGTGESIPVFYRKSRYRVDEEESGRFWLSDTPDVPGSRTWDNEFIRMCEGVRLVDRESGEAFYLYNSHWSFAQNEANLKGAQVVLDRIHQRKHDDPVVLLGDFNATVDDVSIQWVTGRHPDVTLQDCFGMRYPDESDKGTTHDYHGKSTGRQIDYIFVDPERTTVLQAAIVRANRDGLYPSDHFPLTATVRFK